MEIELVIVVPVLMMIVLFVVWAGRVGNAGLAAELAAEEAAVAASLAADGQREQVARDLLTLRPDLDFLCVDGPTPVSGDKFVTEVTRDFPNEQGVARTLGLVGVALRCETDGAVPVLRGLAPTVVHYGRGSEPYVQALRTVLPTVLVAQSRAVVIEGPRVFTQQAEYQETLGSTSVPIEISLSQPVAGDPVRIVATTGPVDPTDPSAVGGPGPGRGGCVDVPDAMEFNYYDYINTSFSGVIAEGEQRLTFPITIIDDCIHEGDETFKVNLTATGAIFEDDPSFIVTIRDNDPPPIVGFVSPPIAATTCYIDDNGNGVWLIDEDKSDCSALDMNIELRHPVQIAHPLRNVMYYPRVRYGVPLREFRISSSADIGPTDDQSPGPDDCSTGDFSYYDVGIEVLGPPTSFSNARQQGEHKDPTQPLQGYNLFTTARFSGQLRWSGVTDDRIDEPSETFTFQITGLDGEIQSFPTLEFKAIQPNPIYTGTIRFSPTLTVRIRDDDPPPEVTYLVERAAQLASSITRTAFDNSTFTLNVGVSIDTGSAGSHMSQRDLAVATYVEFTFSDDVATTAADDAITLPREDLPTFTIPACGSQSPTSDLVDLKAKATEVAANDHRVDIADLTKIVFTLDAYQPDAGDTASLMGHDLFTLSADTSWSITITDP